MDKAAKPPPGPPEGPATEEATPTPRPWEAAQPPDLDHTGKTPGAGLGMMIGVVVALLLAAALAWIMLGQ